MLSSPADGVTTVGSLDSPVTSRRTVIPRPIIWAINIVILAFAAYVVLGMIGLR